MTPVAIVTRRCPTADDTEALGVSIGAIVQPGDCLAVSGDLGAGKTCLIRGVARGMGIDARAVHSPTFVLINEYRPRDPDAPTLVHTDAYRLDASASAEMLGLDRLLDGRSVLAVEWPARLDADLLRARLDISLADDPAGGRIVTLTAHSDSWARRLADLG